MKRELRGLFFRLLIAFTAVIVITMSFSFYSSAVISKVRSVSIGNNLISLGMTKDSVIKVMGKPDTPPQCEFVYSNGKGDVIICFGEKNLVEAIIVRGTSTKYTVAGLKIGDTQEKVKNICGKPENTKVFDKGQVEAWYYPSKNLNFAFGISKKIISFSVNDFNPNEASK